MAGHLFEYKSISFFYLYFCGCVCTLTVICCGSSDINSSNNKNISEQNSSYNGQNSFALLSGTLRLYQKATCSGEEWMSLRCPLGTTIAVHMAQYGKNSRLPSICHSSQSDLVNNHPDSSNNDNNATCQWPTSIQRVVSLCQKKASCKFQTSTKGDPCPGFRKIVEVSFKCRPSEFKSVIGCEDEVIQLKCNRSSRLAIYSAAFGRTEYESVQCSQPTGVGEETCLSSFATETVMQLCHGKRKCALQADAATFGSPCQPKSRMYLKIIHTCVPRKVLQERYQGEPDPDEIMFEADEVEDDLDSSVIEQPSIYSPDHSKSKGWPHSKNSTTSGRNSLNSEDEDDDENFEDDEEEVEEREIYEETENNSTSTGTHDSHTGTNVSVLLGSSLGADSDSNSYSQPGIRIVYLISQGINAYDFITKNSETFYLYVAISCASALLVVILLILIKISVQRRRSSRAGGSSQVANKPSSSSAGPMLSSGISDMSDELSLDMEQTTFTEIPTMPSILKKSSPYDREHADSRREMRPLSTVQTTTLGRNEVVRFSNTLSRHESSNPRSLKQESENNEDFFYG